MRKLLADRDRSSLKWQKRRHRRSLTSRAKLQFRRAKKPWPGKRPTERVQVPHAININGEGNRRAFLRFLQNLREIALERRCKVVLDFTETAVLTAHSMILLVAEVDRIKRIIGEDFSFQISNVKNKTVNQVLVQIGFYSLCSQMPPKLEAERFGSNVKYWRYATGMRVNEDTNRAFDQIEGRLSPELQRGIWKGVSEAVINSVQHAYVAPRGTNGGRMKHSRWWMFSQERDGELTVVVCDLGIGIPNSLPLNWDQRLLSRLMGAFVGEGDDVKAIRASLEVGATRTNNPNRGKGLPQIWDAVRESKGTGIMIFSNRGKLSWSCEQQQDAAYQFRGSINGTVIMWTVQVKESSDGDGSKNS